MAGSENENTNKNKAALHTEGVELTQKIPLEQLTSLESVKLELKTRKQTESSKKSIPESRKSVFGKKQLPDILVKASSILSPLESVPPLQDKLDLLPLDSNYKLKEKFSEGTQGIISSAFDKSLNRDIVIKTLKSDKNHAQKDKSLFVSEARIMAQLDHPSIIPLYGLHSGDKDHLHLAMKHIHGKTLQSYLKSIVILYRSKGIKEFDEETSIITRIQYMLKICEAIDYAHRKGVVHRDLKPENIMIGNYGEVYVMDWGLACLVSPEKFLNPEKLDKIVRDSKRELVGTPCYLAPELIKGGECSPQSDIFSLGIMLLEMVTLQRAVPGKTVKEVLHNIIHEKYCPFRHYFTNRKVPPDLKAIILKAINETPSKRYKSAHAFSEDLKNYLLHKETSARPDNFSRKCTRAMVNHKILTSVITVLVILTMAFTAVRSEYKQSQMQKEQEIRDAVLGYFQNGVICSQKLERMFSYFEDQLKNAALDATNIMSSKPNVKTKIYYQKDYLNSATSPPDFDFAPAYGKKISLDYAVFKPGPKVSANDNFTRKIFAMQTVFKYLLFSSDEDLRHQKRLSIKDIVHKKGLPLNWVYFGLANGSILSYPGKIYKTSYDPRKRPWYKNALKSQNPLVWSEPYPDAFSSKIVITCSSKVYDKSGKFIGVIAMDISLDFLKNKLFASQPDSTTRKYLANSKGLVILDCLDKSQNSGKSVKLKSLPFLEDFQDNVKRHSVMFESQVNGKRALILMFPIPSLDYYYIEQLSKEDIIKHTQNDLN